jgi:alkanesulfonate monooxygenase SsuD/methylene tetrahydromethanopterin reductase-like flavin-dependent oxidoreductase (luciferase family)
LPPFATAPPGGFKDIAHERFGLSYEDLLEKTLIFGDPDRCCKKIQELQDIGANRVLCWMVFGGLEHRKVLRSMKLFAEHVMPAFTKELVPAGVSEVAVS